MTLLKCIGDAILHSTEWMLCIGFITRKGGVIVPKGKIEGVAYLIPLEPEQSWLANNHIDVETWNTLYD